MKNRLQRMNKKVFSTGASLVIHLFILVFTFNVVFASAVPTPVPLLVHVKLDSRPYASSKGQLDPSPVQKKVVTAPKVKKQQNNTMQAPKAQQKPNQTLLKDSQKKTSHLPSSRVKQAFKDMAVTSRNVNTSSVMPVSKVVAVKAKGMQGRANFESTMQNYQGVDPFFPFERNGKATNINSFLGYELYTYEDPADHAKYFRLSIKVEDLPGSLPILPKEILFLIDASNSIGPDMLKKFTDAIEKCVQQLGSQDKFNIMSFNRNLVKMQEESIPVNVANIYKAKDFLQSRQASSTTDLYETVLKSVDMIPTVKPSYIFLLSDGEATEGVTNPQKIINQISQKNAGRIPVFSFGGGYANKYLLNFLAFTNRGWGEFAPFLQVENKVVSMFNEIKDPVLVDLRYYATGLNDKEIYPKVLPDLFKGAEFVLYGKYTSEDQFLFELRGDSVNDVKQYLVKESLSHGRRGDRNIAEEWAMRKVYHLIGQLEYNTNNEAIIREVEELASKFGLKVPQYKIVKD